MGRELCNNGTEGIIEELNKDNQGDCQRDELPQPEFLGQILQGTRWGYTFRVPKIIDSPAP